MIVPIVVIDGSSSRWSPSAGGRWNDLLRHAASLHGRPPDNESRPLALFAPPLFVVDEGELREFQRFRTTGSLQGPKVVVHGGHRAMLPVLTAAALCASSSHHALFLAPDFDVDAVTTLNAVSLAEDAARNGNMVVFERPLDASSSSVIDNPNSELRGHQEFGRPLVVDAWPAAVSALLVDVAVFLDAVMDLDQFAMAAAEMAIRDAVSTEGIVHLEREVLPRAAPGLADVLFAMHRSGRMVLLPIDEPPPGPHPRIGNAPGSFL